VLLKRWRKKAGASHIQLGFNNFNIGTFTCCRQYADNRFFIALNFQKFKGFIYTKQNINETRKRINYKVGAVIQSFFGQYD
jgi:hypothetical protein